MKKIVKTVGSPIESFKSHFQFLVMHQKKDNIIFYSGALLRQSTSFYDEIDETSDAINLHLTTYFCIAVYAISNSDLSFMIEYISSFVLYWCLYGDQLFSDEVLPRFSLRKFFIIMHMTCQRKMVFSRSLTQ